MWWLDAAAVLVAMLCAALAWASRGNLNVDGASYLDLASRLVAGDIASFVQGYWSPVYPVLLAGILAITGVSGSEAVLAAHVLNLAVALGTVILLWRAGRGRRSAAWGVCALTAYLLASARTVRIDAVTPDLLLLLAMVGLGLELLRRDGWRPVRAGAWAGAAFLIKTSIWPWLLVSSLVGLVAWRRQPGLRLRLVKAAMITAIPFLLWTAAISRDAGHLTPGSTGRLTACWYLLSCDGRTPDSHAGSHRDYHEWQLSSELRARVATFAGTPWTYAPWSDPTAWQQGVLSQVRVRPTVVAYAVYVAKQLGLVLGVWMAGLLLLVLLPMLFTTHGAASLGELLRSPPGALMLLGVLGILQFVSVHAEPRLVAPFVMLFALGWLAWRMSATQRASMFPVAMVGLLVAAGIGGWHLIDQSMVTASALSRTAELERNHPPVAAPHRVAVIGPALPMVPDLYRARARVVAQITSPEPAAILAWPVEAQTAMARRLVALGATALWISRGRNGFRVAPLGGLDTAAVP